MIENYLLYVHIGAPANILKVFFAGAATPAAAGGYFLHESRWQKRGSHLSCAPDYSRLSQLLLFQDVLFEAHLLSVTEAAPPAGACGER